MDFEPVNLNTLKDEKREGCCFVEEGEDIVHLSVPLEEEYEALGSVMFVLNVSSMHWSIERPGMKAYSQEHNTSSGLIDA